MRHSRVHKAALLFCVALAGLAVVVSAYMWGQSARLKAAGLTAGLAFCPETDLLSCEAVLTSRYAQWLGLPLAAAGLANYALLLVACGGLLIVRTHRLAGGLWLAAWTSAALGTLAGVWLLAVQVFDLKQLCTLCDIVHACGLLALIVLTWRKPATVPPVRLAAGGSVAAAAVVLLVTGQILFKPRIKPREVVVADARPPAPMSTEASTSAPCAAPSAGQAGVASVAQSQPTEPPEPAESFKVLDARGALVATLDLNEQILFGRLDAERTVIEFMDYGCKHCRKMSPLLEDVLSRHPDWFRVVVILVPGDKRCNPHTSRRRPHVCEIAKAALAVRKHRPDLLTETHETFFRLQGVLTGSMAWLYVKRRCGLDDATLQSWREDPAIQEQLRQHVDLGRALNVRGVPALYADGKIITHVPNSVRQLEQVIADLIGPPPEKDGTAP